MTRAGTNKFNIMTAHIGIDAMLEMFPLAMYVTFTEWLDADKRKARWKEIKAHLLQHDPISNAVAWMPPQLVQGKNAIYLKDPDQAEAVKKEILDFDDGTRIEITSATKSHQKKAVKNVQLWLLHEGGYAKDGRNDAGTILKIRNPSPNTAGIMVGQQLLVYICGGRIY